VAIPPDGIATFWDCEPACFGGLVLHHVDGLVGELYHYKNRPLISQSPDFFVQKSAKTKNIFSFSLIFKSKLHKS
jgi:hypothetical protein